MNAKKIMGAVLVALLAAALFVGAGAAVVSASDDGRTIFAGQVDLDLAGSTWTNGDNKVTFNAEGYITGPVVEGKYSYNDTISMTILNPTVLITAIAEDGTKKYNIAGATYYKYANLTVSLTSPAGGNITDILITNPDGSKIKLSDVYAATYAKYNASIDGILPALPSVLYLNLLDNVQGNFEEGSGNITITPDNKADLDYMLIDALFPVNGEYKIQGIFGNNGFAPGTLESALVGKDVFTFKVAKKTDVTITANVDSVLEGKRFAVTITGQPGATYTLKFVPDEVDIYSAGDATIDADGKFVMPNGGSITVYLTALTDGETTIGVDSSDADSVADVEVDVTIIEGEITAEAEKESYFIGNDVKLAGTNTVGTGDLYFHIKGTNFPFQKIADANVDYDADNGEWTATIKGAYFTAQNPDAGTYTIFITNNQSAVSQAQVEDGTYTTVAVALKQPFISVTEAPAVVVKNTDAVIKGTAEAAEKIGVYIFGTNKFLYTNISTDDVKIELKDSLFTITIKKQFTNSIDAGQYFAVIQHPMYDGKLNVWAQNTNITTAETKNSELVLPGEVLFDVNDRQKANAAEALCQAIDSENIDDMYVKLSFVVAGPQSTINPIPEQIAQGEKLTISGSTNLGKGEVVTVEMLSTAFAAVPKATVGSASFISLVTKTDENGNWEVTFDTSGLNVDEYTVTAAVGSLDATTAKINVVEAADEPVTPPTDEPGQDEPGQDEPVAPETPGFGALAALAGLGAVAVLLLRRE